MAENILTKIIKDKQHWLTEQQRHLPLNSFIQHIVPSERHFYRVLQGEGIHFILECKPASPSKGMIRSDFSLTNIITAYQPYASAISILTDEKYFHGSFNYLKQASLLTTQPILCKDFIFSPYQVYLARFYGADAILLMLSIIDDHTYQQLSDLAHQLGMGVLTEISDEMEKERAIKLEAQVIGINNRNLRDLSIDLQRTPQLARGLPKNVILISASGITRHTDIQQLKSSVNGFLIGSVLMSEPDIQHAVYDLLFGINKICGITSQDIALAALQAGASHGGFIFIRQSKRYIESQQAHLIQKEIPLKWVGVFRNEEPYIICHLVRSLSLHAVQLHGNESDEYIIQLRKSLPKNCQIWRAHSIVEKIPDCSLKEVDYHVFDHGSGGTGRTFNWDILENIDLSKVILAGGLNINNIEKACTLLSAGLDINSGVENALGKKDPVKISTIMHHIKQCKHKR